MVEPIGQLPDGCIGLRAVGDFTVDDFVSQVEPRVDEIADRHEKLRLILHLGADFSGFGDGAWGELTDGIRHIRFHRGAVVTDDGALAGAINVLKWTLHGHVRTFRDTEFDAAVGWVSG